MGEGSEPVPPQFDTGCGEMRPGRLDGPAKDGLVFGAVSPAGLGPSLLELRQLSYRPNGRKR
jgi:hypothetical protein